MVVLILLLVMVFVSTSVAEAYLDPGTGSYLTQWLVAVIIGSIVAIRA